MSALEEAKTMAAIYLVVGEQKVSGWLMVIDSRLAMGVFVALEVINELTSGAAVALVEGWRLGWRRGRFAFATPRLGKGCVPCAVCTFTDGAHKCGYQIFLVEALGEGGGSEAWSLSVLSMLLSLR